MIELPISEDYLEGYADATIENRKQYDKGVIEGAKTIMDSISKAVENFAFADQVFEDARLTFKELVDKYGE